MTTTKFNATPDLVLLFWWTWGKTLDMPASQPEAAAIQNKYFRATKQQRTRILIAAVVSNQLQKFVRTVQFKWPNCEMAKFWKVNYCSHLECLLLTAYIVFWEPDVWCVKSDCVCLPSTFIIHGNFEVHLVTDTLLPCIAFDVVRCRKTGSASAWI